MGGVSEDYSRSISVDSSGNIYTTGEFFGTATFGSTNLTSAGSADIFITKHNSDGTLAWSRKMGGSSNDSGRSIAVDSSGNIYTIGFFAGTATFGNITLTSGGFRDIFITKHNSDGTFAWAQKMGGSSDDSGRSIAVDSSGNIYTTGIFEGTATFGSTSLTSAGSADIFITKHNTNGTLAWARKMGGSSWDYGAGIGVDGSGNIYTTGEFSGTATFGSTSLTSVIISEMLMWSCGLALLWPLARGVSWSDVCDELGLSRGEGIHKELFAGVLGYLAGLPLILVVSLIAVATERAITGEEVGPEGFPMFETPLAGSWAGLMIGAVGACLWAPLVEEALFRGALHSYLPAWMGVLGRCLLVGAIFGLIHPYSPAGMIQVGAAGVVLGFLREWRGSLIAPITAHFLHNATITATTIAIVSMLD
jgi:membrane protease YdiL (CAAX protease family)